jgi:hypothetical protein
MIKRILRYLFFAFISSVIVSSIFIWKVHKGSVGCFDASQYFHMLWFINTGICLASFIVSLTALFNNQLFVRRNFGLSLAAFMGLPLLILLAILIFFIVERGENDNLIEFLDIGLSSLTFCAVLAYQFYCFRKKYKENDEINSKK